MTDQDFANVVNVFAVIVGMLFALVIGYRIGFNDAKKRYERTN
jgi:ABC-type cobalt transport system substrate-binding protein